MSNNSEGSRIRKKRSVRVFSRSFLNTAAAIIQLLASLKLAGSFLDEIEGSGPYLIKL
jgi:hypothetical protein